MSDTVYRLIGPNHNRLITVHPSPVKGMAQISHETAEKLKAAGWKRYAGTAEAEDGWIKPGSDPNLKPRSSFKVDPLNHKGDHIMADSRTVTVKLVADVEEYIHALERYKQVTRELLDMGVSEKDISGAVVASLKLASAS